MKTKLIACALIITIAYHIILESVDCASIRRKKQKSGQSYNVSGNWTGGPNGSKVNVQESLFTDLVGAKAASARIAMTVSSDVGNQSNSVALNKSVNIQNGIHKVRKRLEEDDRIKQNVEMDSDRDDDNGAGVELIEVKNAIENVRKPNIFGEDSKDRKKAKVNSEAKERRKAKDSNGSNESRKLKDINGEMLRFKSNDDGGKEVERKRISSVSIFT